MSFHYGPVSVLSISPIIPHQIVNDVSKVICPHFATEETEAGD